MAEADAEEVKDQFSYMCVEAETIDEVKDTMSAWRKRDNTKKEGDWVFLVPEPPKKGKKHAVQRYCWVVHPNNPGKGGPEVACRAAYTALMHGRAFDIKGNFEKGSEERKAALEKDPMEWPVMKFPNGLTSIYRKPEDSDDEDEDDYVRQYHGLMGVLAVRFKDEVYTADTLTDANFVLHGKTKMVWTKDKEELLSVLGIQASRHLKQMDENRLSNGMAEFKAIAKKNKQKI